MLHNESFQLEKISHGKKFLMEKRLHSLLTTDSVKVTKWSWERERGKKEKEKELIHRWMREIDRKRGLKKVVEVTGAWIGWNKIHRKLNKFLEGIAKGKMIGKQTKKGVQFTRTAYFPIPIPYVVWEDNKEWSYLRLKVRTMKNSGHSHNFCLGDF